MTLVDQPTSIARRPSIRRPRPSPRPAPLAVTIALATPDGTLSGPALRVLDALQALAELQLAAAQPTPIQPTPAGATSDETGPAPAFSLHTASRQVLRAGRALHLTRREYDLLAFLCAHPRQVFSRAQLLRLVWGYHAVGGERTVDVHILRLRAKLGGEGPTIVTVRGIGYRLDDVERIAVTPGEAPEWVAPAFDAGDRVEGGRAA